MSRRHSRGPWVLHENEPNWVYSLWQGEQRLYVGITSNLKQRLAHHRSSQPWWHLVDRIVSDEVLGRGAAMLFEEHDIAKHRPLHNVKHNPDRTRIHADGILVESRGIRRGP